MRFSKRWLPAAAICLKSSTLMAAEAATTESTAMLLRDAVIRLKSRLFPNDTLGRRGERAAVKFLKRQRYTIIHRGYRILGGELDIVAVDGRTVVFVEVKTRASHDAGHPAEAVDPTQTKAAYSVGFGLSASLSVARLFGAIRRDRHHLAGHQKKPTIEHIKNAFEPQGQGQMFSVVRNAGMRNVAIAESCSVGNRRCSMSFATTEMARATERSRVEIA